MSIAEILLLLLYTGIGVFLLFRLPFFQRFQLPGRILVLIFIAKVLTGILYGYLHRHYYAGGDTMQYFADSKVIFDRLRDGHAGQYLKLVFGINTRPPAPEILPYAAEMSYWNDMSAYSIVRFHSLARLISFGYYNVHVVFYNFLTLVGMLYLFLFFVELMPAKKNLIVMAVFFFPSVLFWSSGIHKDGISLAALGLLLYFTKRLFTSPVQEDAVNSGTSKGAIHHRKKMRIRNLVGLLTGFVVILVVRNFWLLLLIPVLISFIWTMKAQRYKMLKFISLVVIYFGLASSLNAILPDWDFLNLLVQKQNEFMDISGQNQTLPKAPLMPSLSGVLNAIPTALSNCLLRPWPSEIHSAMQLYPALENMLLILFLLFAIIYRKKRWSAAEQSLLLFCLLYAITIFIVTGITVPILGALVRYKMVGMLFLLMAAIVILKEGDWKGIKRGAKY